METLKKKIIFWISLTSAMAVVLAIWIISLKSYSFSESEEQIKEMKEQVQEKLQDIKIPEITEPNLEATPVLPEESKLELPLVE